MNDGGPAFPHTHIIGINGMLHDTQSIGGMSLRAYFAGKAMEGMMRCLCDNSEIAVAMFKAGRERGETIVEYVSRTAVESADALIEALEVKYE